jgi:hypothetical protein
MKRWAFNLSAAISTLLLLFIVMIWVRSHFVADRWYWPDPDQIWPARKPTQYITYSRGEVQWEQPSDEDLLSEGLALHGNRVVNLAPGAIEFVIDSPLREQVIPFHSQYNLKAGPFRGDGASLIVPASTTVVWSMLGFAHEELWGRSSRYENSSILAMTNATLLVRRWTAPFWSFALVTAILPLLWLLRATRKANRIRAGRCIQCGYDLRATPNRCPECGLATPSQSARP